jgi:hypothetical protein
VTFLRHLFGLARAHPLAFVLFLVFVVVALGGLVWKGLVLLLGLVRKVPVVGETAANAATSAINKAVTATGSA